MGQNLVHSFTAFCLTAHTRVITSYFIAKVVHWTRSSPQCWQRHWEKISPEGSTAAQLLHPSLRLYPSTPISTVHRTSYVWTAFIAKKPSAQEQNTSWLKALYLNGSSTKEQQMCLPLRNPKPNFLSSLSQQLSLLKANITPLLLYITEFHPLIEGSPVYSVSWFLQPSVQPQTSQYYISKGKKINMITHPEFGLSSPMSSLFLCFNNLLVPFFSSIL